MPIRPENRNRYPKDWKQIRSKILNRAGNKCEWCGIPDGAFGVRDHKGVFHEMTPLEAETASCVDGEKVVKIVLTIAHLDHQPENCKPTNLAALCQRCHNRYDVDHRKVTRAKTRRKKEVDRGQQFMFQEVTR